MASVSPCATKQCITCLINRAFISFSSAQIYDISYIHLHSSPSTGILRTRQCDQLPDGLIAQLVEHCTGNAEVMGSNRVQTWFCLISQLFKLVDNCDDKSFLHIFLRSSNTWSFIYSFVQLSPGRARATLSKSSSQTRWKGNERGCHFVNNDKAGSLNNGLLF